MKDPQDVDGEATEIEFDLLLEAVRRRYGYDFTDYSRASLKRRLRSAMSDLGMKDVSRLIHQLLHDKETFAALLPRLTVSTTGMFRDPEFFASLRHNVIPILRTFPAFKIWHAGCSTGEEVYSMAILLREEGLEQRALLYATDLNPTALAAAREGIYETQDVREFTSCYQQAGGAASFSDYYTAAYGKVRIDPSLRANIVFAEHNLSTDGVFSEMNLVICRNVLIYFNRALQNRALSVFTQSLRYKGFLALGSKESVRFLDVSDRYGDVDAKWRIYRLDALEALRP